MSELTKIVRGRVILPGEAEFAQAGRAWNPAVDQSGVLAVVEAADRDDIAALVRHAGKARVAIAAQSTGHGASGNASGSILLRTNRLGGVQADPAARTARVGAGVSWGEVLAAASPHGLTGLAGSSSLVGVAGYTLGGGLSWFGRKFGLAADSVRAFEIVDAQGGFARVTAESDPELFWALCGGGGGEHAIVTALEFDLHPAPELYGGRVFWPDDRAAAVFDTYREVTDSAPDELTIWFDRINLPGAPPQVAISTTYLGEAGEAQKLLRAFEKVDGQVGDTRGALEVAALGGIMPEPSPGLGRFELLTGIAGAEADALLEPLGPLSVMQVRHLGGALGGRIAEPYFLYMFGMPTSPEVAGAVRARMDVMIAALGEGVSGRKPFNGLVPGESATAALSTVDLKRLRELKRARDPHGLFRANYPVGDS